MNSHFGRLSLTLVLLCNLSACSYVKSLFPDKEKDYQYTTEIAPLVLPDDLKKNAIPVVPSATSSTPALSAAVTPAAAEPAPVEEPSAQAATITEPPSPTVASDSEPAIPDALVTVERIKFADGENRLRMNVPFIKAWRIVGKALTRKSIEVTGRDQEARVFTVQYDPDEQPVADESYWDELVFMVSGFGGNDKTYLLKLEEQRQLTDIVVVDENQQLLSDAASVKLLTLLETTIKADLANK